jgi:hypothetical protein
VHPIHHATIAGENHRESKIAIEHKSSVFDYVTTS